MLQIWEYNDAAGVRRKGVMRGFTDRGGTDVTYRFNRLDENGNPIVYANGGHEVDLVSGHALKSAKRVGAMPVPSGYK